MRTFRFITAGSSASEAQDQTIACNLHLEPLDDISSTQPDDCTCHTEDDCIARSGIVELLKCDLVWFCLPVVDRAFQKDFFKL